MNKAFFLSFILVLLFQTTNISQENISPENNFPKLRGEYFGLKPPGLRAQLFAPGIVSTEFHDDAAPVFNENEVFFRILFKKGGVFFGKIYRMEMTNGVWGKPELASFSENRMNGNMFMSVNGRKIYCSVNNSIGNNYNIDLVYSEKTNGQWANFKIIKELNSQNNELSVFEDNDGCIYWSSERFMNDPTPKLYRAKLSGSGYSKKEEINWFPDSVLVDIIDLEKGYAIYTMQSDAGGYDLFISYKVKNKWSSPINMGPKINSKYMEKGARLSADGKYIFFVSNRKNSGSNPKKTWSHPLLDNCTEFPNADVYWVSSEIISDIKLSTKINF